MDVGGQVPLSDFGAISVGPFGSAASGDLWASHRAGIRYGVGAEVGLSRLIALTARADYARLPFDPARFQHERYYNDRGANLPTLRSSPATVTTQLVGLKLGRTGAPLHPYLALCAGWVEADLPEIDAWVPTGLEVTPARRLSRFRGQVGLGFEYQSHGPLGGFVELGLMSSGVGPMAPLRVGVSWRE